MAAFLNTFSKTTASGAAAFAVAPMHVRDRIALSRIGSGTAEQTEQMHGWNAGGVHALVARYLR